MKEVYNSDAPAIVQLLNNLPLKVGIFWNLLRIFPIKPINVEPTFRTSKCSTKKESGVRIQEEIIVLT